MDHRTEEWLVLAVQLAIYVVVAEIIVWFAGASPFLYFFAPIPGLVIVVSFIVSVRRHHPEYDALHLASIGVGGGVILLVVLFVLVWFFVFVEKANEQPLPWWNLPVLLGILVGLIFSVRISRRVASWVKKSPVT